MACSKLTDVDMYDEQIWNDSLLIKTYENAIRVRSKTEEPVKRVGEPSDTNNNVWKNGECCRTTVYETGDEYEAAIIRKISTGQYVVKYLGYDGEVVVNPEDLKESLGFDAQIRQMNEAENNKNIQDPIDEEEIDDILKIEVN